MLPKSARVRSRTEFDGIFQHGRSAHGRLLAVRSRTSPAPARVGFLVGKRVNVRATIRNRLKRQLRAIVRTHYDELRPVQAAVIAKPGADSSSYAELETELTGLFRQLNVLA